MNSKTPNIAIQLYSVREELEKDFKGTLQKIADIGYEGVEFAWNYGEMPQTELNQFLNALGLQCVGLYAPPAQIEEPSSEAYLYAKSLESPFITSGLQNMVSEKQWPAAIEIIKNAAVVAASEGMTLLYHNHQQELEHIGEKRALDIMLDSTDSGIVQAELDIGFIALAGADPVEYIRRCSGRLPRIHVRDVKENKTFTELGNGVVDLEGIVREANKAGTEWLVYEQTQPDAADSPVESAAVSFKRLCQITEKL